jgi:hypothetical protein
VENAPLPVDGQHKRAVKSQLCRCDSPAALEANLEALWSGKFPSLAIG